MHVWSYRSFKNAFATWWHDSCWYSCLPVSVYSDVSQFLGVIHVLFDLKMLPLWAWYWDNWENDFMGTVFPFGLLLYYRRLLPCLLFSSFLINIILEMSCVGLLMMVELSWTLLCFPRISCLRKRIDLTYYCVKVANWLFKLSSVGIYLIISGMTIYFSFGSFWFIFRSIVDLSWMVHHY